MKDKLKFLLINPTAAEWQVKPNGQPRRSTRAFRFSMLPSLYVAAAMPEWVKTRIVDEDVEPIDFNADADLVGISFMTFNAPRAYAVADAFRARGKPVIVGGYHPTFLPQEAAEHADAVCIGEAETNVLHMMEDFARGRMQKVYDGGLADLAGLPIPDRSLIRKSAYITSNGIQATRGCPHGCTFCSVAAFHRQKHRTRPTEEVIEELRTLGRYVLFLDDSIAANRSYALELFEKMIPLKKRWFSQCGIGIADDPELLSVAAKSGCRGLFVGFESLSDDTLRANHKPRNMAAEYVSSIKRIHDAGIGVFAGFVFGWDNDTADVFPRTLRFVEEAKVDFLQATIVTPFPGTPLFEQMERDGRITTRDWSKYDFTNVVYEPARMSAQTLRDGTRWIQAQFYSRRSMVKRLVVELGYLNWETVAVACAPLNLGYRVRFGAKQIFRDGRKFRPAHV